MSVGYSSGPEVGWPSVRVGALTTVAEFPWLEGLTAIETDAVFSPGDSGGPIFDINGNVLGIAQVIIYRPGLGRLGRQMGVAISEVEAVWEDLKEGKRLNDTSASWFHRRSEEG